MSGTTAAARVVHYPDSDGLPMSDNTLQFSWIGILMWNAEAQYLADPNVFVAGDHLIYAVEGDPKARQAPDAYVAFGRPKGDRGSYKVWDEGGVFPQVVFEVWSPTNRQQQMEDKRDFYDRHGVEEYYIVYPEYPAHADGWKRDGGRLVRIPDMNGWVSPRLGWRFRLDAGELSVFGPDGKRLQTPAEIAAERNAAEQRAEDQRQRADKLAAKLRELGIDPDHV